MSAHTQHPSLQILVVEDDFDLAQATVDLLLQQGHEAVFVTDAREAYHLCHARPFHAAVVDIMLPGVDGLTLAASLRRHWPDMTLVATTGLTELPDAEEAGLERVLVKPYAGDELLACLAELAAKHAAERDGRAGGPEARDEVR